MNTRPTIVILLSTYNGEQYLKEQLDSLFGQSYREFILLVRDDGSSDGTENILADYAIRYPEKMRIVRDEAGNLGASGSFSWLMQYALEQRAELKLDSLYLMFCDQDDTWYEDKIARQVNAM
ncbi:MAG: glycosyltransferase, partial [Pseudohongiellaceae bacterium]